jgi:SAM-dependent methyltransferase
MTTQTYGQQWVNPERVREFVDQTDRDAQELQPVWELIVALLPFERDRPVRVLDIGSGHGVLAGAMLVGLPNAKAVGLDMSAPMMEEGRKRMAGFGDRFAYHVGDFSAGKLPDDLSGTFDLVVSSRAIHHLPPEQKRSLFADIYRRLNAGGCFFDIDNMRPRDEVLRDRYAEIRDPLRAAEARARRAQRAAAGDRTSHEWSDPVDEQLPFLQEAGFQHVDCYWKRMDRAMIGGYKGEEVRKSVSQ